jgi:SnoaL-like domain
MSLIAKFVEQRRVFERAYDTGEWVLLEPYFQPEASYEVMNMPFHCVLRGREAVVAGFKRSVERFDRLCTRTVGLGSKITEEGDSVLINSGIRFRRSEGPEIEVRLWEIATYRDGLISRILDIYDLDERTKFSNWMEKWGEGLDPSYV